MCAVRLPALAAAAWSFGPGVGSHEGHDQGSGVNRGARGTTPASTRPPAPRDAGESSQKEVGGGTLRVLNSGHVGSVFMCSVQ